MENIRNDWYKVHINLFNIEKSLCIYYAINVLKKRRNKKPNKIKIKTFKDQWMYTNNQKDKTKENK